jgi:dihydropyrimidinase
MSTLIKNGRVITASDDYVADIFIEGEVVTAIGKNLNVNPDSVIDASNKSQSGIILPML